MIHAGWQQPWSCSTYWSSSKVRAYSRLLDLCVPSVCLLCLTYMSISSVCLIFPSHMSFSSVYFTLSVCFSVPFYCPPSVCLIFLLHLSVSSSISSVWCYLSVLVHAWLVCMFHCQFVLSIFPVYLICLAYVLPVSTICLAVYHMSFFLTVCLSFLPICLSILLTLVCLHSLCVNFCICAGVSKILPFSRKILF
jgi:hypothetical protein